MQFFHKKIALFLITLIGITYFSATLLAYRLKSELKERYETNRSPIMYDRQGSEIAIYQNQKGHYARFLQTVPQRFKELLVKKEDRFFFWHPGINPLSIVRDLAQYSFSRKHKGSSTITQQLVKILLENEGERTVTNKIKEAGYALALELYTSKEEILTIYANAAYFGNRAQGISQASHLYFKKNPWTLTNAQSLQLLASLASPSQGYPGTKQNKDRVKLLAALLHIPLFATDFPKKGYMVEEGIALQKTKTAFELETLPIACKKDCALTVDAPLTSKLRDILSRNLQSPSFIGVQNGAVVVIKLPENELLTVVGSPNPALKTNGYQINMAIKPRPIGSTIKPFIYAKAFEKGLRPYTLVEDREYKYAIGTGFAFYPKNYDGKYRGTVTLHQSLANSLNVPSTKVLEYVGIEEFSGFLTNGLSFKPIQPLENYALGIALGGLEMDILTLSHYFTIFPNKGILKPIRVFSKGESNFLPPPMGEGIKEEKRIIDDRFIQLVNKILSDRETGIDQFGMKSNLNLPSRAYAVKTGTSRDFHDSWTVGYTPDFLVGVWVGNADNTPMWQVSGQTGAGKIWHEAMEAMLNSKYNKNTPFDFLHLKEFLQSGSLEYGLGEDDYASARVLLNDDKLILSPHEGDIFLLESQTRIPLKAKKEVEWFINDVPLGKGVRVDWYPPKKGAWRIGAKDEDRRREEATIVIEASQP